MPTTIIFFLRIRDISYVFLKFFFRVKYSKITIMCNFDTNGGVLWDWWILNLVIKTKDTTKNDSRLILVAAQGKQEWGWGWGCGRHLSSRGRKYIITLSSLKATMTYVTT